MTAGFPQVEQWVRAVAPPPLVSIRLVDATHVVAHPTREVVACTVHVACPRRLPPAGCARRHRYHRCTAPTSARSNCRRAADWAPDARASGRPGHQPGEPRRPFASSTSPRPPSSRWKSPAGSPPCRERSKTSLVTRRRMDRPRYRPNGCQALGRPWLRNGRRPVRPRDVASRRLSRARPGPPDRHVWTPDDGNGHADPHAPTLQARRAVWNRGSLSWRPAASGRGRLRRGPAPAGNGRPGFARSRSTCRWRRRGRATSSGQRWSVIVGLGKLPRATARTSLLVAGPDDLEDGRGSLTSPHRAGSTTAGSASQEHERQLQSVRCARRGPRPWWTSCSPPTGRLASISPTSERRQPAADVAVLERHDRSSDHDGRQRLLHDRGVVDGRLRDQPSLSQHGHHHSDLLEVHELYPGAVRPFPGATGGTRWSSTALARTAGSASIRTRPPWSPVALRC